MAAINDYFLSRNYKALDSELNAQKAIADEYKKKAYIAQKEAKESAEKGAAYDVVNGEPGASDANLLQIFTKITGATQQFQVTVPTGVTPGSVAWLEPTKQSDPTEKNVIINGISVTKNTTNNQKYDVHLKLKEAVAYTVPNVIEKKVLTELVAFGITLSAQSGTPKTYGDVKEGADISGNLTASPVFIKGLTTENISIGDITLNDSNATGEVTLTLTQTFENSTLTDIVAFSGVSTVYAKPLPGKAQA